MAAVGISSAAKADQAVVVGVQEYAPLVAASTLKGCLNDAQSIADILKQMGFKVALLTNQKATRQAIFDALAASKTSIKRTERFVFYFAGHGRKAPRFAIMPSDATIDGNDIEPKELNEAILAIPAKSRTMLLDSCFSGGMAAGEMSRSLDRVPKPDPDFASRFFDAEKEKSIKFGPPKGQASSSNSPDKLETAPGICYYTASLEHEQALEATMDDGKRHGLFTYGIIRNLKAGKLWSEVHNDVKKQISKRLEKSGRVQNPLLSTQYMPTGALDNTRAGAPKAPPGKTLLDIWNQDRPDPSKISLKIRPDFNVQDAGRQVSLEMNVGQDGYLIVLGQIGGQFYQFYPMGGTRGSEAKVRKGPIPFPRRGERLFFDKFGADHLKAMLFATPEKAESVMAAMRAANGQLADIALSDPKADVPYTSRISVAVGDALIGGSRLANIDGLIKKVLLQNDEATKFLVRKLQAAASGYDKGEAWLNGFDAENQQPGIADREAFMVLLNLAIQAGVLYDAKAYSGKRIPEALKKAASNPPAGEKLWKLNRDLLIALFPEEVNPDAPGN